MRILHVVQPPRGGAPRLVELLAREQARRHDVGVVCRPGAANAVAASGARVWALPMVREVSPREDLRDVVRLVRIMRAFRPDVVHAHSSKAGALSRLAAAAGGPPVVYSPHNFAHLGHEGEAPARSVYLLLERALAPLTSELHLNYEEERIAAVRLGLANADRIAVIPNGIDVVPLLDLPEPQGDPPTIGTFARLWPQKRIDRLLEAAADLAGRGLDFRVAVIGDGPLRSELELHAGRLGLADRTRFIDDGRGAAEALAELDVYVLSSAQEAYPLVPMEAMAAGRAVVATTVGAVPEIVEDGVTGLLVDADDRRALAEALASLLDRPDLRKQLGTSARAAAATRFPIATMSERLDSVYRAASQ